MYQKAKISNLIIYNCNLLFTLKGSQQINWQKPISVVTSRHQSQLSKFVTKHCKYIQNHHPITVFNYTPIHTHYTDSPPFLNRSLPVQKAVTVITWDIWQWHIYKENCIVLILQTWWFYTSAITTLSLTSVAACDVIYPLTGAFMVIGLDCLYSNRRKSTSSLLTTFFISAL